MEPITTKNAYDVLIDAIKHLNRNKNHINKRNIKYVEPIICAKER